MEIKKSTFKKMYELSQSEDKEGLVMLGAGGDLHEWVHSMADLLVREGIVSKGFTFEEVHRLYTTGLHCDLVLIFDVEKVDMGKFAMWRIRFGECSWLSDYVINYAYRHGYDVSEPGIPWKEVSVIEY